MDGPRHRGFERADGAERGAQLRLGARGVELGAAAGFEAHLRQIQRRLLVRDVAARDVELLLLATQFEVGARDLRRDDDLRVALRGFDSAELRVAGFEAAAHAAEEVELPERVEAGVVVLRLARRDRRVSRIRRARLRVAAASVDARREIERGVAA